MARLPEIERGRDRFSARRWRAAYEALATADGQQSLACEDLERLAAAAYLAGEDQAALAAWTRAHRQHAEAGRDERAAYLCCWIGLISITGGDVARGTGWLSRAHRLLGGEAGDSSAAAFVRALDGLAAMTGGAPAASTFAEAAAAAARCGDPDVLSLALLGHGQALIGEQRFAEGRALLDEAMIGVSAGEVSPVLAGIIYCAVILSCQAMFDARRAEEWTHELDGWCSSQDGLRPFRGQCLVHRSEILQHRGDWTAALDEAESASRHVMGRSERVVGHALYQRGELHRLRGAFDEAARLYEAAAESGYEPQPGAAQLLLARGRIAEAAAEIGGALAIAGEPRGLGRGLSRPRLLGCYVEVQVAAGDIDAAEQAAGELVRRAHEMASDVLLAESHRAAGIVLLAREEPGDALGSLREAWMAWQRLEMPYEAARVRMLIGDACGALGQPSDAQLHYEAARAVFSRIGAAPDEASARARFARREGPSKTRLTAREREVLALVRSGAGNRAIAEQLNISEHTVARHMSNIFDKLGVSTRTAASAVAHSGKLV